MLNIIYFNIYSYLSKYNVVYGTMNADTTIEPTMLIPTCKGYYSSPRTTIEHVYS